jgi:hypothetical protein
MTEARDLTARRRYVDAARHYTTDSSLPAGVRAGEL